MTKPNDLEDGSQRIPSRARPRQPWEEEIYQRALARPGFWESLSPEVRAEWEAFDWPRYLVGRPPEIRDIPRRPRRRGEPPREG